MEGWDLNAVRRFVPACVCWGVASAALLAMEWAQAHGGLAELAAVLRWTWPQACWRAWAVAPLRRCAHGGSAPATSPGPSRLPWLNMRWRRVNLNSSANGRGVQCHSGSDACGTVRLVA